MGRIITKGSAPIGRRHLPGRICPKKGTNIAYLCQQEKERQKQQQERGDLLSPPWRGRGIRYSHE